MVTFETTGLENTEETLKIAVQYAKDHGFDIVAATSSGDTIFKLKEIADSMEYTERKESQGSLENFSYIKHMHNYAQLL